MRRSSSVLAVLFLGVSVFFEGCGFDAHPKSGTVACKTGGHDCCPEGYICVGRGASTLAGPSAGTCWDRKDLPPAALTASHDYTPTVLTDPACLVTDWLPPATGGIGGGVDGGVVDAGTTAMDGAGGVGGGLDSNGDAPFVPDPARDAPTEAASVALDGPAETPAADGGTAAPDSPTDQTIAPPDGSVGEDAADAPQGQNTDSADGPSGDGGPVVPRRLPVPCIAPLPTGFCMVSEVGDYIGGGKTYRAAGDASVTLSSSSPYVISFDLLDGQTSGWTADFAAPDGTRLVPNLFNPAQRYPFQTGSAAGIDVSGNGRGCNTITGRFSIEELQWDPGLGLVRFSAIFEQHCEGSTTALRGMINFQASGYTDPTPTPDRVVNLSGKVFRVAYDPAASVAYGLDATNRKLARIDLASGGVTFASVLQVPNDGCLDTKRGRLFVVNKGSSFITEYLTADLTAVRDINWAGTDWGPTETQFKIYCAPDKLYVVDGAWAPGLFTVEGLDSAIDAGVIGEIDSGLDEGIDGGIDGGADAANSGTGGGEGPQAIDHTAEAAGLGGLVFDSTATNLYYWYQYGWSAGSLNTYVRRLGATDLAQIDESATNLPNFNRDPLGAPILLDETRGLVLVKNYIFDATNLTRVVYTLPSAYDTFDGAAENVYALDSARGLLATKNFVYDLTRYEVVTATIDPDADQLFFDKDGVLWFLSVAKGTLKAQIIKR